MNTVLYHIIVITRLFYFKTRQHKESDLVQFAVSIKIGSLSHMINMYLPIACEPYLDWGHSIGLPDCSCIICYNIYIYIYSATFDDAIYQQMSNMIELWLL